MNTAQDFIAFRKRLDLCVGNGINLWASLPGRKTSATVVGKWFAVKSRVSAHEWRENTSCRILQPRKTRNQCPYYIHTVNQNLSDVDKVTASGVVSVRKAYHLRRCAVSLSTPLSNASS